ncbi:MAG: HEAT repeat domain-containing protein [Candidatus Gottesmanbacteria bacterium]
MLTKASDLKEIIEKGIKTPKTVFPEIKILAADVRWEIREVAATILSEMSKKRQEAVINEMIFWSKDQDENIRRTSIESLRYVCRNSPDSIRPILEILSKDKALYVKKAVAHILREISKKSPDFVYSLCKVWAGFNNKNTDWIIKDGMKKLNKEKEMELISLLKND